MKRDYYGVLGVATSASSGRDPPRVSTAGPAVLPGRQPLGAGRARAVRGDRRSVPRAERSHGAHALRSGRQRRRQASAVSASGRGRDRVGAGAMICTSPIELSFQQAASGFEADVPVERLSVVRGLSARRARCAARSPSPCAAVCRHGHRLARPRRARDGTLSSVRGVRRDVSDPCAGCRGRGVAPSPSVIHVVLPPGIDTGTQFRIPGEGHSGPFGGPRGDLVVMTRVHDDPVFTRRGDNLYCETQVTIVEAVLGARVPVPRHRRRASS